MISESYLVGPGAPGGVSPLWQPPGPRLPPGVCAAHRWPWCRPPALEHKQVRDEKCQIMTRPYIRATPYCASPCAEPSRPPPSLPQVSSPAPLARPPGPRAPPRGRSRRCPRPAPRRPTGIAPPKPAKRHGIMRRPQQQQVGLIGKEVGNLPRPIHGPAWWL